MDFKILTTGVCLLFTSSYAFAGFSVPEIDGAGMLVALALLGSTIALLRDRASRKR